MTTVSVVVATHNRLALLKEAVDGLRSNNVHGDVEMVIVNDGSTDGTKAWLDEQGDIVAIHLAKGGPAKARNRGWQTASGRVICFTDDDCVPTRSWVTELTAPIRSGVADIVQGRTMPRPDHADREGPWSRTVRVEEASGWFQTCNIAYRREVLESVGGFDEAFPSNAGEDTDLGIRALESGARFSFQHAALVHHAIHPSSLRRHLAQVPRWGDALVLVKRHPQIRDRLRHGVFHRPTHRTFVVVSLASMVSTRAHPLAGPLLVVGAHLARRSFVSAETGPLHRRFWIEFQRFLVAGYETVVMVRGSIRHRTVVL